MNHTGRVSLRAIIAITAMIVCLGATRPPAGLSADTAATGQATGPTIWFGRTAGYPNGLCSGDRDPAFVRGDSVKIFTSGRVITWNVLQQYPIPQLTAWSVRELIGRARADHFFHIPTRMRDVSCRQAATTYVRIRTRSTTHTVKIYGYLDSRHPAFNDLLQSMYLAVNA